MSDDDLPDLPKIPSFDELGISPEELAELEKELEGAGDGELEDADEDADEDVGGPSTVAPRAAGAVGAAGAAGAVGAASAGPAGTSGTAGTEGTQGTQGRADPEPDSRAKAKPPRTGALEEETSKERAGPRGGFRGPLTLAFLAVAAWSLSSFRATPAPAPASAPDSEFSSARAMTHLVQIARAAHPPGSPEHARVRSYLVDALTDLGLETSVQTSTSVMGGGGRARAVTVRNIVARLPGTASTGAVLATAHYDGRGVSRAAGDDGSGVVTILEAVRAVQTGAPLQNDLIVLFTDAEELGLLGARAFVSEHPWMSDVALVLSFEMRGGGGPSMMFETSPNNGWVIRALDAADPAPMANSLLYEVYRRMPNDTDFTPFKKAGKQGLNFAGIGRAPVYHQAYDSPENFSEATLQHHGVRATSLIRYLGDQDLASVHADDLAYLSVPVLGLIAYPPRWAWALSGVLLLLFAGTWWLGRRRGVRASGVGAGLVGSLVSGGLVAAAGHGLIRWIPQFHPEAGQLHGSLLHSEGWYVLALASAAFAVVTLVFGALRRWFSPAELSIGAIMVPVVAAVVVGLALPIGAMNLQWPALAGVLAAAVVAGVDRAGRSGVLRWILLAALSLPVLAVLIPIVELVWLAMNLSFAPYLGVLLTLVLLLLVPLLDAVREPNRWWAAVVGIVGAGAFLGIGLLAAGPDADRPAPSTLVYALDRGTGVAVWGTDPDSLAGRSTAARSWAVSRIGPVGEPVSLERFTGQRPPVAPDLMYATTAAAVVDVAMPQVTILSDPAPPAGRVRLGVRSSIGAESMVFLPETRSTRILAVNGRALPEEVPIEYLDHWGEPEGEIVLELSEPIGSESLRLAIVEHHFRPNRLVGGDQFDRPPELAPNVRRLSDRAMIRTPVSVNVRAGIITLAGEALAADSLEAAAAAAQAADSVPSATGEAAPAAIDTAAGPDTVAPGTVVRDTQPGDTLPGDTLRRDTVPRDTIPGSNQRRDRISAETVSPPPSPETAARPAPSRSSRRPD